MLGFSSDGDTRLLRSMKVNLKHPKNSLSEMELNSFIDSDDNCQTPSYIQDATHIGTKLRNRLLKPSVLLPMGNKQVSVSHLKMLMNTVRKDIHGLVYSDISPDDRMNFKSLEKVMKERVINTLRENIPDSEATIQYINICKQVTSCSLDADMLPIKRIHSIWEALFFLRIWRYWLQSKRNEDDQLTYNLKDNFISSNAFSCIEVNAYSLLHLILKLRKIGKPEQFRPTLFDSQPCERTFRQLRSMGTINWTRINFTLQDLLYLIARVELQNTIVIDKLAGTNIEIPQFQHFVTNSASSFVAPPIIINLPSHEEVAATIKQAQQDATLKAVAFGMIIESIDNFLTCPPTRQTVHTKMKKSTDHTSESEASLEEDIEYSIDSPKYRNLHIRDYSCSSFNSAKHENRFVEIFENDGSSKLIRKSSIVWLLAETPQKLSNDRLKRVQSTQPENASKRRKVTSAKFLIPGAAIDDTIFRSHELVIGGWCFFLKLPRATKSRSESTKVTQGETVGEIQGRYLTQCMASSMSIDDVLVGALMGFKFKIGKTEKQKQYVSDHYILNQSQSEINGNELEVQSNWYRVDTCGTLFPCGIFYLDVNRYLATTIAPTINKQAHMQNIMSYQDFTFIKSYLNSILNP